METYQSEAVRVIGIIHPVKQKLQHNSQLLEAGPSEHISSNQVKKLEKQAKEVSANVAWIHQVLKELQDKVSPVAQLAP